MKRHLAFALVAVATLAACSKEDLQPDQSSPASNSFLVATVWNMPANSFRLIRYNITGAMGGEPYIQRHFSTAVSFDAYPDINEWSDSFIYSMQLPGGKPVKLAACMLGSDDVIVGLNYVNGLQTGR